jgi:hypothetical protein
MTQVDAPPAPLLLAERGRTLPVVGDHLLGPAHPVLLAATAALQQARDFDVTMLLSLVAR